MQEFRPASLIAEDTALADLFREGDEGAIRSLVERYGSAVTAVVTPSVGIERADDVALDVFVRAHGRPVPPAGDFAPWLARTAEEFVGPVDADLWTCVMATASVDPGVRPRLRAVHLGGDGDAPLDDELTRHELRLCRRLAHLGDDDEILTALSRSDAWVEADPDLVDRVLAAITPGAVPLASVSSEGDAESEMSAGSAGPDARSPVTRFLRPALFGLVGGIVVLFVAIVALSAASGTPQPPDFTAELTPTGVLVEIEGGEIVVTERDAGIEIELDAVTLPRRAAGTFYEGRLTLANGDELSVGTFSEGVDVTLWAGAALDEVVRFDVLARDLAARDDPGDVVLKADLPPG